MAANAVVRARVDTLWLIFTRTIRWTSRFGKDCPSDIATIPFAGKWKERRDCHIKPDLVLIYLLPDDESLVLVRLGSHRELGLRLV